MRTYVFAKNLSYTKNEYKDVFRNLQFSDDFRDPHVPIN